jgi:anti-sigma factor (TIGR02949 family)
MSCAEMRVLLHGMLDHELDSADAVRVETHMQACQDCTAEYRRQGALRAAIRRSEPRYRAPHDLRARFITAILLQTDGPGQGPWWRGAVTGWMGTGVSLALAASLLFVFAIPPRASNSAGADLRTCAIVVGKPSHGCDDVGPAHGQALVQWQA